ncbi:MAG: hypothetical protein GWP60_05140 [Gammaproteobacteria bacterium]|jgi:hypothetical protein|nr:hypothetical protein [Gammaproteobacteria bacterium]
MMRLLGVLVGSALAVAALVVFVGIPEFTTQSSVAEDTVITLPMRPDPPATDPEPEAVPQEAPLAAATEAPADTPSPPETEVAETAPVPAESPPARPDAALQWYAFWSPFRSEIAANGFVDQLQRVTGLDYRVVKVKPGVYEVAFAYEDDQEITANLSQISAATGLQLPEG